MNKVYVIIVLFIVTYGCEQEAEEGCFPDKGIDMAKTYAKFDSGDNALELGREIQYDKDGRPLIIKNFYSNSEHRRVYKNGRLQSIITTRREPSEWYFSSQESLNLNSDLRNDTAIIVSHYKDGRPLQMKGIDGAMLFFDYAGCGYEVQTLLKENGDTIKQTELTNKGGVLIEEVVTFFKSKKSSKVTKYYGYEFNEFGHWIKRNYEHSNGLVTERRELLYY